MKRKQKNPAFDYHTPSAWILAGQLRNRRANWHETELAALEAFGVSGPVHEAGRTMLSLSCSPAEKIKNRIASRLPLRESIRQVPFYLRLRYEKYKNTHIPEESYRAKCCSPESIYSPYERMKTQLFNGRLQLLRNVITEGLVRWGYDISAHGSDIKICKSWNDFYFKVDTGKRPNDLPASHMSLKIAVTAPLEFFKRSFYGLGEHLVVRELEPEYEMDDGTKVLRTWSCDRMDLYDLNSPNVLKERFYVRSATMEGTGLTLNAAIKSMRYKMGKEILAKMGA